MVHSYMRQLNYLIDTSPEAIVNIINGEVSYVKAEKLSMTERIQLFKFFLIKSDIRRQQNIKVIHNIAKVLCQLLISQKYRLHIHRAYDLNENEKRILLKLISYIKEENFSSNEEKETFKCIINKLKNNDVILLKNKIIHNKREEDKIAI